MYSHFMVDSSLKYVLGNWLMSLNCLSGNPLFLFRWMFFVLNEWSMVSKPYRIISIRQFFVHSARLKKSWLSIGEWGWSAPQINRMHVETNHSQGSSPHISSTSACNWVYTWMYGKYSWWFHPQYVGVQAESLLHVTSCYYKWLCNYEAELHRKSGW